jgi:oxygen-independent coproporphyrinogen-3 oxidase
MGDLDNISLYMSIPFCPTICSYCSFPSFSLAKKGSYLEKYIDYLIEEIKYSIDIAKKENKIIDNIYIGGGTPGVLNGQILEKLLKSITTLIDMKVVKEFTFEAGRPELIDQQMLIILKKFGVNRVCINTQTTNNKTLSIIDRNHSSEEFLRAVKLAKDSDINSINVDIIAGLPTEDFDTFKNTLETVINTGVDNITIHTLAIKTNSFINRNKEAFNLPKFETVKYMVEYSTKRLSELGFKPYYMYRQKNMIGNLENIGYSLETKESIYNIRIIEEQHPILALGVGGVSKMKIGYNHFDRIANFKSLEDYFNRFDEVLERKRKFFGA